MSAIQAATDNKLYTIRAVQLHLETVLKDHPIGYTNMVSQDRWFLVPSSITLKCRTFCQEYLVFQDRWSLMAVVSQDRFHCVEIRFNKML